MITIAMDIDGTLRNIDEKISEFLEQDYPHRMRTWREATGDWNKLDQCFNNNREALEQWLYGERAFQVFGQAPKMYPKVIEHLNLLTKLADESGEASVIVSSVQKKQSITATLFWLSKNGCRAKAFQFHNDFEEKMSWEHDIVVDDHPGVLERAKENGSVPIVVPHPYNEHLTTEDGYVRLDYEGDSPKGLSEIIEIAGLNKFQIVGE